MNSGDASRPGLPAGRNVSALAAQRDAHEQTIALIPDSDLLVPESSSNESAPASGDRGDRPTVKNAGTDGIGAQSSTDPMADAHFDEKTAASDPVAADSVPAPEASEDYKVAAAHAAASGGGRFAVADILDHAAALGSGLARSDLLTTQRGASPFAAMDYGFASATPFVQEIPAFSASATYARPTDGTVDPTVGNPQPAVVSTDPYVSQEWHLQAINVLSVWGDYNGKGVTVGIIDDGVQYTHPDLAANYNMAIDYDARTLDNDAQPETGDNHGTTVAGTIAAPSNGLGVAGVAFGATVAGFRMGYGAAGTTAQIADNLNHQVNVDVSNNSWGYGGYFGDNFSSPSFASSAAAIKSVAANGRDGLGTVVVFAAGNDRTTGNDVNYHNFQNSQYTIAVAATDQSNHYASFSTPGAALLVSAPGAGIITTDRTGASGYVAGDYVSISGTSFSAPIVSGVVALMLEANPELGYRDVQEILAYSARQVDAGSPRWAVNHADTWNGGGLHYSPDYGFGLVDAHAAVRLAETWTLQSTYANLDVVGASSASSGVIPDNNPGGISRTVVIPSGLTIDHVEVDVSISHTWIGDLRVELISPDGTRSVLVNRPGINPDAPGGFGTSQDNINFTLTSTNFWGETGTGTWTLVVSDNAGTQVGTLNSWTLRLYGDTASADNVYVYTDEYGSFTGANYADRRLLVDDAGSDTINAAAITASMSLDLTPGATSTLAGNALVIGAGTVIENAYGGDGNDSITGNASANFLSGGRGGDQLFGLGGNDLVLGGAGDDFLWGGTGEDKAVVDGMFSGYQINLVNATTVTLTDIYLTDGNDGVDTLHDIEFVQFNDQLYALFASTPNSPPVAANETYSVNEDNTLTVALSGVLSNDSDPDGNALTAALLSGPSHGTLALNANGSFSYTPTLNYNGSDSFTYQVADGNGGTASATTTINVTALNDAPVAANETYTVNEDNTLTVPLTGVLSNDSDPDGNALTAALLSGVSHGTLALNANGSFSYTPTLNYSGSDSFTYRVADGNGGTATATATINVTAVNDVPVAANETYTVNEDNTLTVPVSGVLSNDSDPEGNPLTAALLSGPSHGTLALNANGSFTYTPTLNYSGSDSFTYRVADGNGGTATATATITVSPVNDAPVAANETYTVNEDNTLTVPLSGVLSNDSDPEGNPLTAALLSGVSHGALALNANGSFTYTPNLDYSGSDSFTYQVSDGNGGTATATATINVTPASVANIAPVAANDAYAVNEDNTLTVPVSGVLSNDSDPNGDPLTAAVLSGVSHGTLALNANGSFSYTPDLNYTGSDSFTYQVADGKGGTATAIATIAVNTINDAPVAADDIVITSVRANTTLVVPKWALLANDSDVDGNPVSISAAGGPSVGDTVSNASASVDFEEAGAGGGSATGSNGSFSYTAIDGTLADTANVTVAADISGVINGTNANEILIGHSANNSLSGGGGNDILIGGGGTDTLSGGAGDDILVWDGADTLTGGAGFDTLRFETAGTLAFNDARTNSLERIDLVAGDDNDNGVTLSAANVIDYGNENGGTGFIFGGNQVDLFVTGDAIGAGPTADNVTLTGGGWTDTGANISAPVAGSGVIFSVYTSGAAILAVQDGLEVAIV